MFRFGFWPCTWFWLGLWWLPGVGQNQLQDEPCVPSSGVKEDFAPPLSGMPGPFPVYLRLPYRRDSYFCFKQETKRNDFLSILTDCIRHQNQGEVKDPSGAASLS